ncbi:MAG: 30S ribosomal protein S6 [Chloroflexaceae bacterium]|nr:30S ribosomal protein S6 [Chloroflexaceae bacterium]
MRERRRTYELMIVINPLFASDDEIEAMIQRIAESIEASKGELLGADHSTPWGRRRLAYPIRAYLGGESSRRSFMEGYYILFQMILPSSQVIEVERTVKLADTILRYLLTEFDPKNKNPYNVLMTRASAGSNADMVEAQSQQDQ